MGTFDAREREDPTRRPCPPQARRRTRSRAQRGPLPLWSHIVSDTTSHAQDTRKSARLLTRHGSGAHLTRSRAPSPYITFLPPPSLFFLPLRCSCMLADNRRQGPAWPLQSTSQAPACNQRVSLQRMRPYEPTACQCQSPADFVYFSVAYLVFTCFCWYALPHSCGPHSCDYNAHASARSVLRTLSYTCGVHHLLPADCTLYLHMTHKCLARCSGAPSCSWLR